MSVRPQVQGKNLRERILSIHGTDAEGLFEGPFTRAVFQQVEIGSPGSLDSKKPHGQREPRHFHGFLFPHSIGGSFPTEPEPEPGPHHRGVPPGTGPQLGAPMYGAPPVQALPGVANIEATG
ncbi:MAG: hypothetical protein EA421_01055 [Gemmatimonadales bacterium]|nr:MAG: hypothetical protein EA421_01055 [Gemmatimonadales bacterium]